MYLSEYLVNCLDEGIALSTLVYTITLHYV